jgi:hypothetical protein
MDMGIAIATTAVLVPIVTARCLSRRPRRLHGPAIMATLDQRAQARAMRGDVCLPNAKDVSSLLTHPKRLMLPALSMMRMRLP